MWRMTRMTVPAILMIVAACGELPGPTESGEITTSVNSMNESDIDSFGFVSKDENISNESGNPWGRFIDTSESVCGGSPTGFEVLFVTLSLDTKRSDIDGLEDVFTGPVTVYFASTQGSDQDATQVDIAGASSVSGTGPVSLEILSTRAELQVLHERLVGGDFHVGIRGTTDRTGEDSFSMTPQIVFRCRAFCD